MKSLITKVGIAEEWQFPFLALKEKKVRILKQAVSWIPFVPFLCPPISEVIFAFVFLATQHSIWDLSSPTREWTLAPCSGSAEAYHWPARATPRSSFFKICSTDTTCILNRGSMQSSAMLPHSRGFFLRRTCHPGFQLGWKAGKKVSQIYSFLSCLPPVFAFREQSHLESR